MFTQNTGRKSTFSLLSAVLELIPHSKEFEREWGILDRLFKRISDLTSVKTALPQYQRAENCPATGVSLNQVPLRKEWSFSVSS